MINPTVSCSSCQQPTVVIGYLIRIIEIGIVCRRFCSTHVRIGSNLCRGLNINEAKSRLRHTIYEEDSASAFLRTATAQTQLAPLHTHKSNPVFGII